MYEWFSKARNRFIYFGIAFYIPTVSILGIFTKIFFPELSNLNWQISQVLTVDGLLIPTPEYFLFLIALSILLLIVSFIQNKQGKKYKNYTWIGVLTLLISTAFAICLALVTISMDTR